MKFLSSLTNRLAGIITGDRAETTQPNKDVKAKAVFSEAFAGPPSKETPPAEPTEADVQTDEPVAHAPVSTRFDGPWPLDSVLMRFRRAVPTGGPSSKPREVKVPYTLGDAYMGMFVLGGNGAGKTSGTGAHVGLAFLKQGFGGVILCAKAKEADDWEKRVIDAGRGDDLVMFGREKKDEPAHGFNFLAYEMSKGKGNPAEAATNVLMELVGANQGGNNKDPIWEKATRKLIKNCLMGCQLAGESPTLRRVYQLATDKKAVEEIINKGLFRQSAGELSAGEQADLDVVFSYLGVEWAGMNASTKTSILMNASTLCDPFLTGEIRDRFTVGTTHTPDDILNGKIIVVCLDKKTYDEAGRSANILWKYCTQRAVERRQPGDDVRPTFIYADECQFFVTKMDGDFVTTSRSSRCSMVYLTQSKSNLLARLGKDDTDAILACFQTKVFHHNTDPESNNYAADTIAKTTQVKASNSANFSSGQGGNQGASGSTSYSQSIEHQLMPVEFTRLGTGGRKNGFIVTAFLYLHGDLFSLSGKPKAKDEVSYVLVFFHQINITI